MDCRYCKGTCQKAGKQENGAQRLYCGVCGKYQQVSYKRQAYETEINDRIKSLLCEGVGIRGISRVLRIAVSTVLRRIRKIARQIDKPVLIDQSRTYEVDELWTYIGNKSNDYWGA